MSSQYYHNELLTKDVDREKGTNNEIPVYYFLYFSFFQVQNLTQNPMSIISKAGPILSEEHFIDMMPVAWELLLESDQELAAASGIIFRTQISQS